MGSFPYTLWATTFLPLVPRNVDLVRQGTSTGVGMGKETELPVSV